MVGNKRSWLSSIEEVWMIAALAEMHKDVLESGLVHLPGCRVDHIDLLGQDLGVPFALHS